MVFCVLHVGRTVCDLLLTKETWLLYEELGRAEDRANILHCVQDDGMGLPRNSHKVSSSQDATPLLSSAAKRMA